MTSRFKSVFWKLIAVSFLSTFLIIIFTYAAKPQLFVARQKASLAQKTTEIKTASINSLVKNEGTLKITIKEGKKVGSYSVKYKNMPAEYNLERNKTSGKKMILFFNRPSDFFIPFDDCGFNKCEFTDDKRDYLISDAILFHAPSLGFRFEHLPPKPRGQIWVYMSHEPPSQTFNSYKDWINVFNWTWTNRRDSDIYAPYGEVQVNTNPVKMNLSETFKMKNKTAFWFVSHCKTRAKREEYVKLLQKHIEIDVLGRCSSEKRKRDNRDKYTLAKFYKFHISFENSLCRDYITEKILHILPASIVPIVRGEPTSELFLPPGSYIDTKHYNSSSQLGNYLKELQYNETEYIKYFNWKNYYKPVRNDTRGICSFCKLLHSEQSHHTLYNDINEWVNNPGGKPLCKTNIQDLNR